jgi:P-type Ca2+ transporter type 2C
VLKNPWFIGVQAVTLAAQVVIIFKGGEAFNTRPLTGAQWGWSMLFGILAIPLGALLRQVPDEYVILVGRFLHGLLPTSAIRNRKIKKQQEAGTMENWVLTTGEALLQPIDYGMKLKEENQGSTGLLGTAGSLTARQREALSKTASSKHVPTENSLNLHRMVEIARTGSFEVQGSVEVHPDTAKDDPVLVVLTDDGRTPPSQNVEVVRYIGKA